MATTIRFSNELTAGGNFKDDPVVAKIRTADLAALDVKKHFGIEE